MVSNAIYIPLLWIVILGSRPVSVWFGGGASMESTDDYLEGSPFDRMVFLFLILAGAVVLLRRRVNWKALFTNNKWLLVFTLFWGISVLWSDYPFVALKRVDFGRDHFAPDGPTWAQPVVVDHPAPPVVIVRLPSGNDGFPRPGPVPSAARSGSTSACV